MVNDAKHGVEVMLENIVIEDDSFMFRPNQDRSFIDLCDC